MFTKLPTRAAAHLRCNNQHKISHFCQYPAALTSATLLMSVHIQFFAYVRERAFVQLVALCRDSRRMMSAS